MASCDNVLSAARKSGKRVCYAENWVYSPAIQKEREMLVASGGQLLWIIGSEAHSGSHSPYYGTMEILRWRIAGRQGMPSLSAALYLKRVEGESRGGAAIVPVSVSARTHEITRMKTYRDEGFLRTRLYRRRGLRADAHHISQMGRWRTSFHRSWCWEESHSWLEVFANNHRTRCNFIPIDALQTFNPREDLLKDVYITEKLGTKQGWSHPAPG